LPATTIRTFAQAKATAKIYNAAKGNYSVGGAMAKVSRSTFESRVKTERVKWPKLFKTFEISRGGAPKLNEWAAKEAWQAFQEANYSNAAAARALNVQETTFRKRVQGYARQHDINLDQLKSQRTMEAHAEDHRERMSASAHRAKLKDAARLIADLQDQIRDLQFATKASFKPAEWTLPHHPKIKREHTPYLLTSDFQIGEVIRAEETEAGYGYDSAIFRRRYRRMIETTIYLSFEHAGTNWKFPGIIYARGGDTISGGIHDELKETDDLTPIEAVECAFEEESAGIRKLADAFGRVDVKSFGAAGNHDRNLVKPTTKNVSGHSYDRMIAYMLGIEFKNDKRVTFQTSQSFDVRFNIYDMRILLTHGDRMGSSGGQGFIGPAATIMRGVQKVVAEQAALGFKVDRVDHGHFHTPQYLGWVLSNGCMPGYSEYAKQYRMRPSPPQQFLTYNHPRRGVVDIKPIILTEA
jgi:hypothetical protein